MLRGLGTKCWKESRGKKVLRKLRWQKQTRLWPEGWEDLARWSQERMLRGPQELESSRGGSAYPLFRKSHLGLKDSLTHDTESPLKL